MFELYIIVLWNTSCYACTVYENTNIEFSDKFAIFDIWLRNFEYTGRFPYIRSYGASTPISDFTGRGHFVTYIRYSGTKWPCKFEVRYLNPEMDIFDIFAAASFEYAVYSNLAATAPPWQPLRKGLTEGGVAGFN